METISLRLIITTKDRVIVADVNLPSDQESLDWACEQYADVNNGFATLSDTRGRIYARAGQTYLS